MLSIVVLFIVMAVATAAPTPADPCAKVKQPDVQPYNPPVYQELSSVKTLASYTPSPFCTALVKDSKLCEDYMKEIIILVAVPIVCGVIFGLVFLFYLCCRKKCCACCKLPEAVGPMVARLILVAVFGLVFIVSFISFDGRDSFKNGIANVGASIDSIVGTVDFVKQQTINVADSCDLAAKAGTKLSTVQSKPDGSTFGGICAYQKFNAIDPRASANDFIDKLNNQIMTMAQEIVVKSTEAKTGAIDMNKTVTLPSELVDIRNTLAKDVDGYIDMGMGAMVGVFVITAIIGAVGLVFLPGCFFSVFFFLGFLAIVLNGVTVGFELPVSAVLGDVCTPNPRTNLVEMVKSGANLSTAEEFFDYVMFCNGTNPVQDVTNQVFNAIDVIETNLCDVTKNFSGSLTLEVSGQNVTLEHVDQQGCTYALQELANSFSGIATAAVDSVKKVTSCATYNEPLLLLTDQAICSNMTPGLGSMWQTQVAASVFLLVAMFLAPCVWDRITHSDTDSGRGIQMA